MESFNFGAFDTNLGARIANIPQEAQKQQSANMLQAMQMQGAMRQNEMSQMKINEMLAERKEIDATAAMLKTKGYTPKSYFSMLLESRNPDRQKTGAEGLYRLNRQDEFNTLFKGSLGEMFGAAPAPAPGTAPPTTDAAVATPPVSKTPSQVVPMPQAGGAPVNTLATGPTINNLGRPVPTIEQMEQMALKMGTYKDVPGAETVSKLLEEKIKAARAITSGAPGSTILQGGLSIGTVPTEFEALLKSSGLSPDEMTAARKARVGKESTASYEFLTTLAQLGKTTDPYERTQLKNRLTQLSTHAPGTTVNVDTKVGNKYGETFAKGIGEADLKLRDSAIGAKDLAANANQTLKLLENPQIFTGGAANIKLNLARALNVIGDTDAQAIANTEQLIRSTGKATLASIKNSGLGTGQGFTDKDLKMLQGVEGGTIELNADTLRAFATAQHNAATAIVRQWETRRKGVPAAALIGTGLDKETYTIEPKYSATPSDKPDVYVRDANGAIRKQ